MRFFRRVLADFGRSPRRWLDAGAGDAWLAHQLLNEFPATDLVCWDAFYEAADLTRLRAQSANTTFTQATPEGPFDLITALDVLEHVEDDRAFLQTLVDALDTDGTVLISVPAWPRLFTSHDTHLLHFRRYRPQQLQQLIRGAGLQTLREGGLFHSLLPVRALQKLRETMTGPPNTSERDLGWNPPASWITGVVGAALAVDNQLSRSRLGRYLPGLSYWALCVK